MQRGDLYRTRTPVTDPRPSRAYVVVSRDEFLRVPCPTVVCVPIYSTVHGLATEVIFDSVNGLGHTSAARCDEVTSVPRAVLRDFVGAATPSQLQQLSCALAVALNIAPRDLTAPQ